jgi:hypothetical protein
MTYKIQMRERMVGHYSLTIDAKKSKKKTLGKYQNILKISDGKYKK